MRLRWVPDRSAAEGRVGWDILSFRHAAAGGRSRSVLAGNSGKNLQEETAGTNRGPRAY